ncbi:MAG: hypothetical protein LBC85_04790 [Fibromonadaceae bacterium]|jgi:hypothetical protein|nr:hypothetical protein [Fibromonadaceae bacterium]
MTNSVSQWIEKASLIKDPLVEAAGNAASPNEQVNWLLFASALKQGIDLAPLQKFIVELQKNIKSLAELPAPSEDLIFSVIAKCRLRSWSLASVAAGIAWSVGRFARARDNRLDLWVKNHSASDIWRSCGEIFYMGKTSPLRPKALDFLFRVKKGGAPLPHSAGARRWLIKTNAYNADESPKEKLRTANSLYKKLYPKNPALACHALQFFTEPLGEGYFCQKISPCNSCLVAE